MESIVLCIGAFAGVLWLTKRSLIAGLNGALTAGFFYGIVRANVPQAFSHFIFDAAALGLYLGIWTKGLTPLQRLRIRKVRPWVICLVLWPVLLFFIPVQDPLIQLVGLRGSIWFVPFLIIGALINDEERSRFALWLAILNLVAVGFALAEFHLGIERFFPRNEVTALLYKQNDVVQHSFKEYRIPATFVQQSVYSATMVLSMPLLVGAWVQAQRTRRERALLAAGMVAAMLGVFLGASRSQALFFFAQLVTLAIFTKIRMQHLLAFAALAAAVGYWVYKEPRLQRFTQVDTNTVEQRVKWSVNESFLDALVDYPAGNGLGGGGTSMPYFLQDRLKNPVLIENEYGRILLETGVPGLCLWAAFIIMAIAHASSDRAGPWRLGWVLARVTSALYFGSGFIGVGLFTAIPNTCLLLMLTGWMFSPKLKDFKMTEPFEYEDLIATAPG